MCVKSLVDKAAFETIGDNCSHLNNFCTVMEHIFIHRIQGLLVYTLYIHLYTNVCVLHMNALFEHINEVCCELLIHPLIT